MLKQERAVRTLRSLVHSAAKLFLRHGYAQAKLAEISADAGVSTGALHFHFESKAALASAVQVAAAASLREAVRTASRLPGVNALQSLTDASHALADTLRRDVVARAGLQLSCDTTCPTEWDMCQEWQESVRQLLARAAHENLLAEDAIRHDAATSIVAATTGMELLARSDAEWLAHATLTRFWELMLPSLATPEALAELEPAGTRPGGRRSLRPAQRPAAERVALVAEPLLSR
ncbi:ScbR family autoregulator-binding transcription factor [Streptomyces violascens]|uniref:ScbR family autoregulator-binding transcription factor n=1 Tax=Streptomyces violascens TaxID=67381 RepID=UPI00365BDFA4